MYLTSEPNGVDDTAEAHTAPHLKSFLRRRETCNFWKGKINPSPNTG